MIAALAFRWVASNCLHPMYKRALILVRFGKHVGLFVTTSLFHASPPQTGLGGHAQLALRMILACCANVDPRTLPQA